MDILTCNNLQCCFSSWSFHTEDHDIAYGLFRKPLGQTSKSSTGKVCELLPVRRVNSHEELECSSYVCDEIGTCKYLIYFDFQRKINISVFIYLNLKCYICLIRTYISTRE